MVNERVAVALEDVAVGYRRGGDLTTVVRGIDATLECGRLVALLGRNGAGKSTLLRTLAAFQQPLAGKVCYGYNEQGHLSQQELAKKVAVVLTGGGFAALTVRELVSLGRTPYTNFMGRLTRADKEIVEAAMQQMGVAHLAQRQVDTLSDGERQKCLIAKAIAQQTPLMLLDEPTAFLDFQSKVALFRTMRSLAGEAGKAVLVSTHDVEMALRFADELWIIADGKLHVGTPALLAGNGVLQSFIDGDGIKYDKTTGRVDIIL